MNKIQRENIEMSDPVLPIKTYIVNSDERDLAAASHIHAEVELIYIMEGSMTFHINQKGITVDRGKIIVINSHTIHASEMEPGMYTQMCLLQFNPGLIYDSGLTESKYLAPFIHHDVFSCHLFDTGSSGKYTLLAELLTEIAHEFQQKDIAYEILIKSNLYKVLTILYRDQVLKYNFVNSLHKEELMFSKLEPVIRYVDHHYTENITLETACRLLNLNYHYFCRLFKTATGKPFIQYLNYVRISVAERLLLTTDKPVVEIICDTGFSSLSYFNRTFKKLKGCNPTEYRRRLLQE